MGLLNIGAKILTQGAKAATHTPAVSKTIVTEGLEGGAKVADKVTLGTVAADSAQMRQTMMQAELESLKNRAKMNSSYQDLMANLKQVTKGVDDAKAATHTPAVPKATDSAQMRQTMMQTELESLKNRAKMNSSYQDMMANLKQVTKGVDDAKANPGKGMQQLQKSATEANPATSRVDVKM